MGLSSRGTLGQHKAPLSVVQNNALIHHAIGPRLNEARRQLHLHPSLSPSPVNDQVHLRSGKREGVEQRRRK